MAARKSVLGPPPNHPELDQLLEQARNVKLTDEQLKSAFTKQADAILKEALGWPDGNWTFSPLARLRSGIRSEPKVLDLLLADGLAHRRVGRLEERRHADHRHALGYVGEAERDRGPAHFTVSQRQALELGGGKT